MSDIYSIARMGMLEGQRRLESISANAQSASLPGYKRRVPVVRPFELDPAQVTMAGTSANPASPSPHALDHVDLRPGQTLTTGRALDLSIQGGNHFFALSDGARTWLTRDGSFVVGADGYLTGERGLRVQGIGGDIRLDTADVQVLPDGRIQRNGVDVAAIELFAPDDTARLAPGTGALVAAGASGIHPVDAASTHILAGTLESSNAGAATEMVDLLALTRQFESLARVTQGYDDLLGRTIEKLGDI